MDKTRKYYAVRRGRNTGIFDTWNECAEQVHKYGGAVYKAFTDREAAERYLHEDDGTEQDGGAVAYIDGSYSVARGLYAWGGFIDDGAAVYVLQGTGDNAAYLQYRNITGEIRGALDVMEKAQALQLPEITIYHDCEGVGRWALGEWKCNNELTAYYREYFKRLQKRGGLQVHFKHVQGHTGIFENELADALAKEAAGVKLRKKDVETLETFKQSAAEVWRL